MAEPGTMLHFAGSLALLASLIVLFAALRPHLPGRVQSRPLLGLLFGGVAILQMNMPFSPVDGLIVDMRNVPVALAGAFLGMRGLVICLSLAIAARLQIGGVGMSAGVAAMILAGGAGLAWHAMTAHLARGAGTAVALALMMSGHIAGVLLLPADLALWFLAEAGPVVLGLNLVAVPPLALLLEGERQRMIAEASSRARLRAAAGRDLPPPEALRWELAQAAMAGPLAAGGTIVAIRLRAGGLRLHLWGEEAVAAALAVLCGRLRALAPDGAILGRAGRDTVILAVPLAEGSGLRRLLGRIRREVTGAPVAIPGMASLRLGRVLRVLPYEVVPDLDRIAADIAGSSRARRLAEAESRPLVRAAGSDTLFQTFDRLHSIRFGSS